MAIQLSLLFPSVYAKVSTFVLCCILSTVLICKDQDCQEVGGVFTLCIRQTTNSLLRVLKLLSTFLTVFKEYSSRTKLTERSCKVCFLKMLQFIWRGQKGLEINKILFVSGVILSCGFTNIQNGLLFPLQGAFQPEEGGIIFGRTLPTFFMNVHSDCEDRCTMSTRNFTKRDLTVVRT